MNLEFARSEFLRTRDAGPLISARTGDVDAIVVGAHRELLDGAPVALFAVGGYGRRHLFPHSDVDLLLLLETDAQVEASKPVLGPYLQKLWDSNLRLSQSVRTPEECSELHERNIELNVSLLDARFLAGDRRIAAMLHEKLPRFIHGRRQNLIRNLAMLTRDRHLKYHDTFLHLEPNVKETPGGLRDYQLLCWLSQLRNSTPNAHPTAEPYPELAESRDFLFALRCFLHYESGRDNNALTFDAQESAAAFFGARDAATWMRDFYRHARNMYRASARLLEAADSQTGSLFSQFRDWRSRLSNTELTVLRERIYFKTPRQLDHDPALALRAFEFVGRHGLRLSQDAEQRLAAHLPVMRRYFAEPRAVWPALKSILSQPHADMGLAAMHETGALQAIFPEHEQIECLVIRDFYHRYTVDEHTLMTIRILRDLHKSEDRAVKAYGDLLAEMDSPAALYFALLFHDVGKGTPGEGHVTASVRLCESAMERIGMPEPEREMVRFLIDRHLALSETINTRDLEDPTVIEGLARSLGTIEKLKALTLLTYADISAVNPGAMTPWRRSQLWRLYLLTYNELTRELEADRIEPRPADSPERAAFLQGFPTRYLRTHSGAEIDAHLAMEKSATEHGGVAIDLGKLDGAYRLTLVAADRPYLFASVAGTLSSFGMNILKAEAFANKRGTVLDTFTFSDPLRTLELNPDEAERLKLTLERVLLGKTDVAQLLLAARPKSQLPSKTAQLPPTLQFDSDSSPAATLIHVVAQDRPGMLYDLASTMSSEGCNIEVVLIDTEGHKAIDVFYVTSEGSKLDESRSERLRSMLLERLT